MPEEKLDKSSAGGGARNQSSGWGSAYDRMHGGNKSGYNKPSSSSTVASGKPSYLPVTPPSTLNKNHIPSANFTAADPTALEEGMKVEHQKFGFGIIKTIEGSSHNPIANILFDVNGEKKIMLNYAKLMIINS
jgi:DNA helicase-2/ATP-dependent DNA helicase PcrA